MFLELNAAANVPITRRSSRVTPGPKTALAGGHANEFVQGSVALGFAQARPAADVHRHNADYTRSRRGREHRGVQRSRGRPAEASTLCACGDARRLARGVSKS